MPTLEQFNEYVKSLSRMDWYYEYSDDGSVYRRGREALRALQDTAGVHTVYASAYAAWLKYIQADRKDLGAVVERDYTINLLRARIEEETTTA